MPEKMVGLLAKRFSAPNAVIGKELNEQEMANQIIPSDEQYIWGNL